MATPRSPGTHHNSSLGVSPTAGTVANSPELLGPLGLTFSDSTPRAVISTKHRMSLRERAAPRLGIIEPCLPSPAKAPPSGPGWIHEIKHDGFRILARRDKAGVRLITRNGNDFSSRAFSALTAANAGGVTREQARNAASSGTGVVNYDRDGGIVSGNWR